MSIFSLSNVRRPSVKQSVMVTLRKQELKSGNKSLFIDYYINGKRFKEYLNIVLIKNDKAGNSEKMRLAEAIRSKRDLDLISDQHGVVSPTKRIKDFKDFWQEYIDQYSNENKRMLIASLKKFDQYHPAPVIFAELNELLFEGFLKFLNDKTRSGLSGESPSDYFRMTKKILDAARKSRYLLTSPASDIKNVYRGSRDLKKEVLFPDEISLLAVTPCSNDLVKRACLFATQTGLRYCDIVQLRWKNVSDSPAYISFEQSKTHRRNHIPLNSNAIVLMGARMSDNTPIFDLAMSKTMVTRYINHWVKASGIRKHITFHCFRHSFVTNVLASTGNLKLASALAGHSTTKHTERYTHIVDRMKEEAVNNLPNL